ncbi:MAG: hypothetical protein MZW92_52055 [Comamonadaceae bacterium]|nr:hypothetical protein [Comamonadaceae bacterium]
MRSRVPTIRRLRRRSVAAAASAELEEILVARQGRPRQPRLHRQGGGGRPLPGRHHHRRRGLSRPRSRPPARPSPPRPVPGRGRQLRGLPQSGRQPGGAIVVGLGRVGSLTPGGCAVHDAGLPRLRRRHRREATRAAGEDGRASRGIASLLIGTGAGNMTLESSVAGMVAGVVDANRLLQESGYGEGS